MRLGIDIPFFSDPLEIRDYVQAAEELGYHHIGFSEHIIQTRDSQDPARAEGFTADDPWYESVSMLGFLAGVTTTIELNTAMCLLPLHHPIMLAKQTAELQRLSGGRLRLGASIGWIESETRSLGVEPRTRGARFEEQIQLMRMLWTQDVVEFSGRFFTLSPSALAPRLSAPIPIWMGGGSAATSGFPSERTIRRAAGNADGFKIMAPATADMERSIELVDRLRTAVTDLGRGPEEFGIEGRIVLQITTQDEWPALLERWDRAGVTHVGLANRIAGGSMADQLAAIEKFAQAAGLHRPSDHQPGH